MGPAALGPTVGAWQIAVCEDVLVAVYRITQKSLQNTFSGYADGGKRR